MANTWLMWGLFPVSLFFAGFATANDSKATEQAVLKLQQTIQTQSKQMARDKDELKALMILGQLNQIFDAMCGALRNARRDEADQWERQFTEKIIEYNRISMVVYPMRNCG